MLDSPLYGLGIPTDMDLDGVERLEVEDLNDIQELILDAPLEVSGGQRYAVELLVLDPREFPDLPQHFGDLFGEEQGELTGSWRIYGEHDGGRSYSEAGLAQNGRLVQGTVLTHWASHQGEEWIVQEFVEGTLVNDAFSLVAQHARVLQSPDGEGFTYELDSWRGTYDPRRDSVSGISEDAVGQRGHFVMERAG